MVAMVWLSSRRCHSHTFGKAHHALHTQRIDVQGSRLPARTRGLVGPLPGGRHLFHAMQRLLCVVSIPVLRVFVAAPVLVQPAAGSGRGGPTRGVARWPQAYRADSGIMIDPSRLTRFLSSDFFGPTRAPANEQGKASTAARRQRVGQRPRNYRLGGSMGQPAPQPPAGLRLRDEARSSNT